jgi:hypothetical protein
MAKKTHKICTILPEGGAPGATPRRSSDEVATGERIDNVRVARQPGGTMRTRAAVERLKLWDNGRTVRVLFMDGDTSVKTKVADIAKEWEVVANLKLNFVNSGAAEIRISFLDKGFSWSTVGTDALTVPRTEATMNYGWLEPNTQLREYQRVVRHEFGHALGMIHEHQNPDALGKIPWDRPKVYAYYAQQGWSQADVDSNIFAVYDEDDTNFSTFDSTSIMEYAVPDALTVGSYAIGWNTELSQTDRDFMRRQYPATATGTVELAVDGARFAADLAVGAEVDTYQFEVADAATYIMTTSGPTDTLLTLHGPNDSGAVLTFDDDRGAGLNARITRKLQPAEYWLSVRHKSPGGQGTYDIGVKRRKG